MCVFLSNRFCFACVACYASEETHTGTALLLLCPPFLVRQQLPVLSYFPLHHRVILADRKCLHVSGNSLQKAPVSPNSSRILWSVFARMCHICWIGAHGRVDAMNAFLSDGTVSYDLKLKAVASSQHQMAPNIQSSAFNLLQSFPSSQTVLALVFTSATWLVYH